MSRTISWAHVRCCRDWATICRVTSGGRQCNSFREKPPSHTGSGRDTYMLPFMASGLLTREGCEGQQLPERMR